MDPLVYLAREFEKLKKAQRDQGSTPQLGTSSMHDDGSIPAYDINGTLKQIIGYQPDGTTTVTQVNGPPPPAPTAPTVELMPQAVRIKWDGLWVGGAVAPLDLLRIDVHIVQDDTVDPLTTPSVATISSQGWGDTLAPLPIGIYYAVLIAWTQSGQRAISDFSGAFEVEPFEADLGTLPEDLEAAKVRLAELQTRLDTLSGDLGGLPDELAAAQEAVTNLETAVGSFVGVPNGIGLAIDEAAVSIVTDDRLVVGSLNVWPFAESTIPAGALEPGAIGSNDIADFALAARKFNIGKHIIY